MLPGAWTRLPLLRSLSQPRSRFSLSVLQVLQVDDSVASKLFSIQKNMHKRTPIGVRFLFGFSILFKNAPDFNRLPSEYLFPASSSLVDPRCLSKPTEYLIKKTWGQLARDLR
jgi:hypothetical protein